MMVRFEHRTQAKRFQDSAQFPSRFCTDCDSFSTAHPRFHYIFKVGAGSRLQTLAFRANVLLIMQFALGAILLQRTGAEKGDSGYYQQ
jgi:hypothetical protein